MPNVYVAPLYEWVIFLVVVTYLGAIIYFWSYLKRFHSETWLRLGSPSFLNNSIANGYRTLRYLVGSDYRDLRDPFLSQTIWIIRELFVLILIMIVLGSCFGLL